MIRDILKIKIKEFDDGVKLIRPLMYETYRPLDLSVDKFLNDANIFQKELHISNPMASLFNSRIPSEFIQKIICRFPNIPISYGGNVTTLQDIDHLFNLGINRIFINPSNTGFNGFLKDVSNFYGHQSIVPHLQIWKYPLFNDNLKDQYFVMGKSAKINIGMTLSEALFELSWFDGEIAVTRAYTDGIFNSIENRLLDHLSNTDYHCNFILGGGVKDFKDYSHSISAVIRYSSHLNSSSYLNC